MKNSHWLWPFGELTDLIRDYFKVDYINRSAKFNQIWRRYAVNCGYIIELGKTCYITLLTLRKSKVVFQDLELSWDIGSIDVGPGHYFNAKIFVQPLFPRSCHGWRYRYGLRDSTQFELYPFKLPFIRSISSDEAESVISRKFYCKLFLYKCYGTEYEFNC